VAPSSSCPFRTISIHLLARDPFPKHRLLGLAPDVTAQTLGSDEDKGGGSAVLRTLPPEPKPDKIRRTCRHRKETPGNSRSIDSASGSFCHQPEKTSLRMPTPDLTQPEIRAATITGNPWRVSRIWDRRCIMITVCFNPVCKRELLYLREGRVVRLVKTQGGQARVEHFWLCGDCYQLYDFQFSAKGGIRLLARAIPQDETGVRKQKILLSAEICQEETTAA
jgi:hypothetical protein